MPVPFCSVQAFAKRRGPSGLHLAGKLPDGDDDELGRLQRREADDDVDDPEVDVVLSGRLGVALDEVGVRGLLALERAAAEQAVHEGAGRKADLRPQRLVIRLEYG